MPSVVERSGALRPVTCKPDGAEAPARLVVGGDLGNHLAVIGGGAEGLGVKSRPAEQPAFDRGRELVGRDLGRRGTPSLLMTSSGSRSRWGAAP